MSTHCMLYVLCSHSLTHSLTRGLSLSLSLLLACSVSAICAYVYDIFFFSSVNNMNHLDIMSHFIVPFGVLSHSCIMHILHDAISFIIKQLQRIFLSFQSLNKKNYKQTNSEMLSLSFLSSFFFSFSFLLFLNGS